MFGDSYSSTASSRTDTIARRRLSVRAEKLDLDETSPISLETKFPLLYARQREVDDLLLQEVYVNMFRVFEVPSLPFSAWRQMPSQAQVFRLSPKGPQLIGGMLFADGGVLFNDTPFIRSRVKDVRCLLEFDIALENTQWLEKVPVPPTTQPRLRRSQVPPTTDEAPASDAAGGKAIVKAPAAGEGISPLTLTASGSVQQHKTGSDEFLPTSTRRSWESAEEDPSRDVAAVPGTSPTVTSPTLRASIRRRSNPAGSVNIGGNIVYASPNGIVTSRVYFRVEEYDCISLPWVVQMFQLVEPTLGVTFGPVFTRAFMPAGANVGDAGSNTATNNSYVATSATVVATSDAVVPSQEVNAAGNGRGAGVESGAAQQPQAMTVALTGFGVGITPTELKRSKRKALAGEERLRVTKPWLYVWCLDRNPSDLGAAATVIKELLLYFKHSFSVIRTVRTIMNSVRLLQMVIRRMITRKARARDRMVREWNALEEAVLMRLEQYRAVDGDGIDHAVNELLKTRVRCSEEAKRQLIEEVYAARQEERRYMSRELQRQYAHRFRFVIPGRELLAEYHKRLLEELCRDEASPIYSDARVVDQLRDRVEEEHLRRVSAEKRAQRLWDKLRNKGTFGTSDRSITFPGMAEDVKELVRTIPLVPCAPSTTPHPEMRRPQINQQLRKALKPQHLQILDMMFEAPFD